MFYEIALEKPLEKVIEAFKKAVEEENFSILHHYHFSEALAKRNCPIDGELYIYDICSPKYAQSVLKKCVKLGCMIPCRMSIYSDGDKTYVYSLKPAAILDMLKANAPSLAEELKDIILEVDKIVANIFSRIEKIA